MCSLPLLLALRKLTPCQLGGPPYEPASAENNHAQEHPFINSCGNDPQREHGRDHGQIIRSSVAAVRAIAPPRIQNARRAHPDEGGDPDDRAN